MLLNLIFSFLAVFHLTYLGSMFDPGVDEQEVEEVRGPDLTASVSVDGDVESGFGLCLWCAGVSSHPHHPQVVRAELGESLGGVCLLGLLPVNTVSRRGGHVYTRTHTHTHAEDVF